MVQTPKRAFQYHRNNARKRKIKFSFTFEEWVKWWETNLGPDWYLKRGCKSGQYVMARKRDRGAYKVANVKCIPCNLNNLESMYGEGRNHPLRRRNIQSS